MFKSLVDSFLVPPPVPPLAVPLPLRYSATVQSALGEVCRTFYFLGAADGFSAGLTLGCVVGAVAVGAVVALGRARLFKS